MPDLKADEWMDEIDNALEYRRQFGMEDAWQKLELDYTNDPAGDTSVGPNLVYSMGDSLLSSLTVPNPEFLLTAEHKNGISRAPIVEAVDNHLIKFMKMKKEVENAIISSYLFSRAILKIGYDSEFGWSPYYDVGTENNLMGMTLTQFDKKGRRIEYGNAHPGMPWVKHCLPHDIVVPWGTVEIEDAPWVAHRLVRLNEYLKKDVKYKNTSKLEPTISMEGYIDSYGHVMAKNKRSTYKNSGAYVTNVKPIFNEIWEIHDKMSGRIFVVSRDSDKFLRNGIDALQVNGLPFVSTTLVKHPRTFWGTPQAYYLGQMQATQHDISIQSEKTRRINNLKFLMSKNLMDVDQMNQLISGDVGAIGEVESTQPLREAVIPFPQGNSLDFVMQSNANRSDARDAIGFSRNQLGEFDDSSRRTAREATFVNEGSQTRTSRRMGSVIDLYIDTIRKVNSIIFRYWKMPRYMMIGNEQVKFTGEELEGDYLYDVTLSTKRNVSMAQRKMESLQMMIALSQIPGVNLEAMKQYIMDASGDPAFEALLGGAQKNALPTQGQGGGLPTIPATGGQG